MALVKYLPIFTNIGRNLYKVIQYIGENEMPYYYIWFFEFWSRPSVDQILTQ